MRQMPPGYSDLETVKMGPREWIVRKFWQTPYGMIPAGFKTDGASSPRLAWSIVDPGSEFFEASIIHDFLYRFGIGTRAQADAIWREAAIAFGANPRRAALGYYALRLGGVNFGWNKAQP